MKVQYGFYKGIFGYWKIGYCQDWITGICAVPNIEEEHHPSPISDLAAMQLEEYVRGERREFSIPYQVSGTDFQKKVWEALSKIPYGETRTYKEIAIQIGNEKSSRAVGQANHENPLAIVIPCHRVIGSNGRLTGYAGGLSMKERLLEIEQIYLKKN